MTVDDTTWDLVVIGGGAAGFFGALAAAESGARVLLLEGTGKFLSKVEISGGGRCNVTHACFDAKELTTHYPRGSKELRGPFSRFQPKDTVEWFQARGIELKVEADGRMFPKTDLSKTIINCFLDEAARLGVELRKRARVESITVQGEIFEIETKEGKKIAAQKILLATGSSRTGYSIAEKLGHTITPCAPSLFTFEIDSPLLESLPGVSFPDAKLVLKLSPVFNQEGPALITHWGLSGPSVLRLSAWAARELAEAGYHAELEVSWCVPHSVERGRAQLKQYREEHSKQLVCSSSPYPLVRRFWERICQLSGVAADLPYSALSNAACDALCNALFQSKLQINGKGEFKEEFVTCGGIQLSEVDFKTMQSKFCPGLFFAGELLDVDGETGGFNFQNAWTTAWHAAEAICRQISENKVSPTI